jgi:DNA-binding MarR family transcriptional regulator
MRQLHSGPLPAGPERDEFLEQQPTYWLKRCYQALRRTVDAELKPYGLTLSQRDVLLLLYHDGSLDQGTLSERLGLEQSSVSRLIEGLARQSLVVVRPGEEDQRVRLASLTTKGEQALRQTPGSSALGGALMVDGLTLEERDELVRLLRHCAHNLSRTTPRDSAADRRTNNGDTR